ncbi:condensation domain-containing protein [Streptomyces sp. NPDC088387]|uniref:condensation domain-containing protein n=1 Tax=Streptomyces sp. NPDC088387 TaxID=3365859 RepID=UPI0037F6AC78
MSNRVELGEVRAALLSLPGVGDAAVHTARQARGALRIVAHVVTRTPPAQLRAALEPRLPPHLMPALIHRVPHIPRLPDGAPDHRALATLTGRPDGLLPDGSGVDGAGVDGAGADGAGVDGAGVDGAGADGAGADGSGVDGAGMDGVEADAVGTDGIGTDAVEADGIGADAVEADGIGADAEDTPYGVGGAENASGAGTPGAEDAPRAHMDGTHPPAPPAGSAPAHPAVTAEDFARNRPPTLALTPHQRDLLRDAFAHPGTGRYVEQLFWRWRGPLDLDRFTTAWQSVFDRETVLRAAFDGDFHEDTHEDADTAYGTDADPDAAFDTDPDAAFDAAFDGDFCDDGGGQGREPRLVLHEHVRADIARHPASQGVDFQDLLRHDRRRGFDLRSPGLLRVTVADEPGSAPRARILLTYHQVLLDAWSVWVLLQEFYRAYLSGGPLPGGERRPDIRDYARWLAGQDTAPARDFWSTAAPGPAALIRPGSPGPATGLSGAGRAEARLDAAQLERLRAWAASCTATESSALQAVWALLLYRAGAARAPAPVGFGVTVSGRGIALDAVERLPGLLANSQPMTLHVDPAAPLDALLAELRDRALDMAGYEWASLGEIHRWSGRRPGDGLVDSLIVLDSHHGFPRGFDDQRTALAAEGIGIGPARSSGVQNAFPVTLLARPAAGEGLVLVAVHDRARLADPDAARLVGQCARLLRELPDLRAPATVADALALLAGEPPVHIAPTPGPDRAGEPTRGDTRS